MVTVEEPHRTMLALALVLVFVAVPGVMLVEQHQQLSRAQAVPATVTSSEVVRVDASTDDAGWEYEPRVEYTYEVDGTTYTSRELFPGATETRQYSFESEAAEVADQFPAGTTVEAYYDPADPAESFLIRRADGRWTLVGMAAFGLFGVALLSRRLVGLVREPADEESTTWSVEDPRCPECGEPIGATAVYCMHCSADLSEERAVGGAAAGAERAAETPETDPTAGPDAGPDESGGALLDPDGWVDNTLTAVVGVVGGLVVGVVGSLVLLLATTSGWGLLVGAAAWLGATVHLVRRRTVAGAVAHTAYAVAIVLLLVPLVALTPGMNGGTEDRVGLFVALLLVVVLPAGAAAVVGWVVSWVFVPDAAGAEA